MYAQQRRSHYKNKSTQANSMFCLLLSDFLVLSKVWKFKIFYKSLPNGLYTFSTDEFVFVLYK